MQFKNCANGCNANYKRYPEYGPKQWVARMPLGFPMDFSLLSSGWSLPDQRMVGILLGFLGQNAFQMPEKAFFSQQKRWGCVDGRSTLLGLEARIKVVEETIRNSTIGRFLASLCCWPVCQKWRWWKLPKMGGVLIILSTVTLATIAFWPHLDGLSMFIIWEPGADLWQLSRSGGHGKNAFPSINVWSWTLWRASRLVHLGRFREMFF